MAVSLTIWAPQKMGIPELDMIFGWPHVKTDAPKCFYAIVRLRFCNLLRISGLLETTNQK